MTLAESDGHSSRLLSSEGVDGAGLLLLASYCHDVGVAGKVGGGDGWKERGVKKFSEGNFDETLIEGNFDKTLMEGNFGGRYYGLNRGLGRRNEVGRTRSGKRRDEGKRRC